jgi:hypothetical protein
MGCPHDSWLTSANKKDHLVDAEPLKKATPLPYAARAAGGDGIFRRAVHRTLVFQRGRDLSQRLTL